MPFADFRGRAKRLDDIDLPALGSRIGVGEDQIHAVLEVEARGSGFDRTGRPAQLFEPHVFFRELGPGARRDRAVRAGLAYPSWGERPYPTDSYPRLFEAMMIDETAALRSASWGLGQIMGFNFKAAGFTSPQAMVRAFMEDEEAHLSAMVNFIIAKRIDDELRRHDWAGFARVYNGERFRDHDYDGRLARAFAKWQRIKDTPWTPGQSALETAENDPAAPAVVFAEPSAPPRNAPVSVFPPSQEVKKTDMRLAPEPRPAPKPPIPGIVAPDDPGVPVAPAKPGFWSRFFASLFRRLKGA